MAERPELKRCTNAGRCMADPRSYRDQASRYSTPKATRVAEFALQKLEEARAADVAAHEENAPILAANVAARERVTAMMKELGVPDTFSEVVPSRSRYVKRKSFPAGYLGDLTRNFPVDDGFDAATATYIKLLGLYRQFESVAADEDAKADAAKAQAEERKKEARRANIELVQIILRYGLDQDADWPDVLEALRVRDQRLDLAAAMQSTRGDWSEGPWRVRDALDRFKIENDEDKAIANDVIDCLTDFEDGRVFRDTTWSYGRLFAEAKDQQLATDVQAALSRQPY